jgi:hypothetical protein
VIKITWFICKTAIIPAARFVFRLVLAATVPVWEVHRLSRNLRKKGYFIGERVSYFKAMDAQTQKKRHRKSKVSAFEKSAQ